MKEQVGKINSKSPGFITSTIACNANQYAQGFQTITPDRPIESFYAEPSISESFLIKENGGSLSFAGNTAYGWYCPGRPDDGISDYYQKQFLKYLLSGSSLGEAFWISKSMCYSCKNANEFNSTAWWVYNSYNLLGDPSLKPIFTGQESKVDKIDITPKILFCEDGKAIQVKAWSNGISERISDTDNIQWSLNPPDAGELEVNGDYAYFRCKNINNRVTITVKYNELTTSCIVLSKKMPLRVKITPERCNLIAGAQVQFTAQIIDDSGFDYSMYFPVKWYVDNQDVGAVDETGLFWLIRQDKCTVMAVCEELGIGWVAYINYP